GLHFPYRRNSSAGPNHSHSQPSPAATTALPRDFSPLHPTPTLSDFDGFRRKSSRRRCAPVAQGSGEVFGRNGGKHLARIAQRARTLGRNGSAVGNLGAQARSGCCRIEKRKPFRPQERLKPHKLLWLASLSHPQAFAAWPRNSSANSARN